MVDSLASNQKMLDVDPLDPKTQTPDTGQPLEIPKFNRKPDGPKLYQMIDKIDPVKLKALLVKQRSESLIMRNAGDDVGSTILTNPDYAQLSYKDKIKMSEKYQTPNLRLIDRIGLDKNYNSERFKNWYLTNQNKFTDQERNAALKYLNNKQIQDSRNETYGNTLKEKQRENNNKNAVYYNIASREYRNIHFDIDRYYDSITKPTGTATGAATDTSADTAKDTSPKAKEALNKLKNLLDEDLDLDLENDFQYSNINKTPIEDIQKQLWTISEDIIDVLKKRKVFRINDKVIPMPSKDADDFTLRNLWFQEIMSEIDNAKKNLDKVTPFTPPEQQPLTGVQPAVINENSSEEDIQSHFRKNQGK